MTQYKVVSDTSYQPETSDDVVRILEWARCLRVRVRIELGDTKTGRAWEDSEVGYIGRSTGRVKVPLVLHNSRSHGGPSLLDHCVLRISESKGGKLLYQHPNYSKDQ